MKGSTPFLQNENPNSTEDSALLVFCGQNSGGFDPVREILNPFLIIIEAGNQGE